MYSLAKYFHIVGIISWLAGILYLYRLFVYHFDYSEKSLDFYSILSIMERRLYKYITVPAMTVAVFAGGCMIYMNPFLWSQTWFKLKVLLGLFLVFSTLDAKRIMNKFNNRNLVSFTSKRLRIANEIPTLLMLIIVALVIFRPNL